MTISEIKSKIVEWIKTGVPKNVKSANVRTLLSQMAIRMDVQEVGRLKVVKASGNESTDQEIGDKVSGVVEDTFIVDAIYLGGNISLLASYAQVNDPNYQTDNPTENEYADIAAMLADQANQTQGFDQRVLDASADSNASDGEALYRYLGSGNGQLTNYIRLSDADTGLGAFTKKGGYQGTAKDLKDLIDAVDTSGFMATGGYAGTGQDLKDLIDGLAAILASDDTSLDIVQEIVDFIKINKTDLDAISLLLQSDDVAYDTLQEIVDKLKALEANPPGDGIFEPNVFRVELLEANTAQANADLINAAINSAKTFDGVVILPAGNFLTRTITWDKRVTLKGMGKNQTRLTCTHAEPLIQCTDGTFTPVHASISGMQLRGGVDNNNKIGTHGLDLVLMNNFHFFDLVINNFADYAVNLEGCLVGKFEACHILLNHGGVKSIASPAANNNFGYMQSNLVNFDNCHINQNEQWAVNWDRGASISFTNGCDFESNGIDGNPNTGVIKMTDSAPAGEGIGLIMSECWGEYNRGTMFDIQGNAATKHVFRDCMFQFVLGGEANPVGAKLNGGQFLVDNSNIPFAFNVLAGTLETRSAKIGGVTLSGTSKHLINGVAETATGTIWNLGGKGIAYNYGEASSATTYGFINAVEGRHATGLINAPSKPTVTSATEISGAAFVADTDMELVMEVKNGTVRWFLLEI